MEYNTTFGVSQKWEVRAQNDIVLYPRVFERSYGGNMAAFMFVFFVNNKLTVNCDEVMLKTGNCAVHVL